MEGIFFRRTPCNRHKLARNREMRGRDIPIHSSKRYFSMWFSVLQRGTSQQEVEQVTTDWNKNAHQSEIIQIADSDKPEDFLEYAAIVASCDLVITTGSTVAHLAAGIGIPTWVLLPKVPDWRWGLEGDTLSGIPRCAYSVKLRGETGMKLLSCSRGVGKSLEITHL